MGGGFAASGMGRGLQGRAMALPRVFAPPQGFPFDHGPSVGRRGGFHIRPRAFMLPRGAAGWGHPALRSSGWRRPSRLAQNAKFIRRGGIYPARRCLRCHRVPGTMQASSPTEVCDTITATVPHLPHTLPSVVGADSISARRRLRRRKPGRYGIGPYRGCDNTKRLPSPFARTPAPSPTPEKFLIPNSSFSPPPSSPSKKPKGPTP